MDTSPYHNDGGISDGRLQRFYLNFLGCELISADRISGLDEFDVELARKKQQNWVRLDLAHFVELRHYR